MATKSVITKIRRKKMAEASHTTGTVAKITHIALGSGGVNGDGTVIVPLAENVALKKEVVRKPYTSSTKTSDTSYCIIGNLRYAVIYMKQVKLVKQ